jgi:hypothetical protein
MLLEELNWEDDFVAYFPDHENRVLVINKLSQGLYAIAAWADCSKRDLRNVKHNVLVYNQVDAVTAQAVLFELVERYEEWKKNAHSECRDSDGVDSGTVQATGTLTKGSA